MVALLVKGIKPKKLKVDDTRKRLLAALEIEGRLIAKEFDKTTSSWTGAKPKFEILTNVSGNDAEVLVGPVGSEIAINKWVWLDKGTRPHVIRAKRKPSLVFKAGFKAKTRVNTFASSGGGSFGPTVAAKSVQHPGTEARNWSDLIVKRRRKPFTRNMLIAARVTT